MNIWLYVLAKSFAEYSVVAPPELRIYDVCCVGLSAHDNLRIKNPTEHWIKVTFEVVKVTIDGQETSDCSACPFTLKSHAVVEPNHTQEIKVNGIKFRICMCLLSVMGISRVLSHSG